MKRMRRGRGRRMMMWRRRRRCRSNAWSSSVITCPAQPYVKTYNHKLWINTCFLLISRWTDHIKSNQFWELLDHTLDHSHSVIIIFVSAPADHSIYDIESCFWLIPISNYFFMIFFVFSKDWKIKNFNKWAYSTSKPSQWTTTKLTPV